MNKTEINLNWPLLGNGQIIDFLARSIESGRVAGSYIFVGPADLGKATVAKFFSMSLLCQNLGKSQNLPCGECASCRQNLAQLKNIGDEEMPLHADLHLIRREPDKKNVSTEDVRELIRSLGMSSFMNSFKIGIIKDAECLNDNAANALLKTLEEPKDKVVIILIASELEALPATIVSRSRVLRFKPVKSDVIYDYLVKNHKVNRSLAKSLSRLCLGRPALAVRFLEDREFYNNYLSRVKTLLSVPGEDINGRFALLGQLLGEKAAGQESSRTAKKVIETWQALVRDLLLLKFGQPDLVQHEAVIQELEYEKVKFSLSGLLNLSEQLRQAEGHLNANVNPRAVLEGVAVSI